MIKDTWTKCVSQTGTIRGVAVRATQISKELAKLHKLSPSGASGLSESIVAGFLLSSYCKMGERMNLNIKSDGVVKQALVDAYPDGKVRGYVIENPDAAKPSEDLTGEGFWGKGFLSVLRQKEMSQKEPYIGTVPLMTGHLAKDLTYYWLQSEQVPSAVGISVRQDKKGQITSAGGFLIQAMPGASPEELKEIESRVYHLKTMSDEIASDRDPIHLLSQIFQTNPFVVLEKRDLVWECNCSWERVNRALLLTGEDELRDMHSKNDDFSIHCDFCQKHFVITHQKLEELLTKFTTN